MAMAALLFPAVLLLAMVARSSGAWCVCKQGQSDAALQKALDFACGAGADCNPTHQNGPCFNPNTVLAHCNYAVNSYFQRKGQAPGSCDFSGAASVVNADPSTAGCAYPASASASTTPVTSTTPSTTNPTPTTANPTTPSNNKSPYVTNPSTGGGVLGGAGGVGPGLGPSGAGINDESDGGIVLLKTSMLPFLIIMLSGCVFLWG